MKHFFFYLFKAAVHSLIIFIISVFSLHYYAINSKGNHADIYFINLTIFISSILVSNIELALNTRLFNKFHIIAFLILSIGISIGLIWILGFISKNNFYLAEIFKQ